MSLYTLSTSGVLGGGYTVRYDSTCFTGTGTHNPSLSAIPTVQKQFFAGIAALLLVIRACVIPGLSREDSCDICVSHRATKDVLGLQGHHNSCKLSTNYGALVDLIESFDSFSQAPQAFIRSHPPQR